MFTGLVEALGTVRHADDLDCGRRLVVVELRIAAGVRIGESIAVNGACLTVVERESDAIHFQVGPETLRLTNLGELRPGDPVNLERALRLGDRLGGHWVQGHVDGVGTIASRQHAGPWETTWFTCPASLTRQMVRKGSICVDGVSLTLVDVESDRFSVALIPHTLTQTTLGSKPVGATVNLETDILAKYVEKCLEPSRAFAAAPERRDHADASSDA
jgi:riboflavin synthase